MVHKILATDKRPNSPFPLDLTWTGTLPGACQFSFLNLRLVDCVAALDLGLGLWKGTWPRACQLHHPFLVFIVRRKNACFAEAK